MDALPDWPALLPSGGVVVILAWLIIRVMNQAGGAYRDYHMQLAALRESHAENIEELARRHEKELSDLRSQNNFMQEQLIETHQLLRDERAARWRAEDAAAKWRRQVEEAGGEPR